MIFEVLFALWFFLPAGMANLTPILVARLPVLRRWNAPMDGGLIWHGHRIFGSHKTWRGLCSGVAIAVVTFWLQQLAIAHIGWLQGITAQVDYASLPTLPVGALFGLGALLGDALESFFKRQRGIAPGHGWFPFDQTDYIVGGALATAPFVALSLGQYVWLITLWLLVHVVASFIGYHLGLKERPI